MDAIALLKKDHAEVKKLFRQLLDEEPSPAQTEVLFHKLRRELSIHADIEEQLFYPTLRERNPDLSEDVLEALEEHHVAKVTLMELEKMSVEDERFCAKLAVLREAVLMHVKEEEKTLFPKLRKAVQKAELEEMARMLAQAKRVAPIRPHPMAPDMPPANRITSLFAGLYDRTMELAMNVARLATRPLRA